jgi:CRP/FNR family transcriptional regulator, cyclic AMP receptor protein
MAYNASTAAPGNKLQEIGRQGHFLNGGPQSGRRPAPWHAQYRQDGSRAVQKHTSTPHFDQEISWDTLAHLFMRSTVSQSIKLPRRHAVYGSLDNDRSIYLIEHGQVKAVATSHGGKECLIGIYTAGEVFGELSIICPQRTEMVTTMTPVVLRRIHAAKALNELSDTSSRDEFIRRLTQRLLEQQRLIVDLVTTDSEHRLATILLYLGRKLGRREGPLLHIESRITQEELASMVGTTRSRVGYFLKRFIEAHMVARTGAAFLVLHEPRIQHFISADC